MEITTKSVGLVPPNNLDIERAVLGSILKDNSKMFDAQRFISGKDFYDNAHAIIFNSMVDLSIKNNGIIDLLVLTEQLTKMGKIDFVGGVSYITTLCDFGIPSNIENYAKIVQDKSMLRKIHHICNDSISEVMGNQKNGDECFGHLQTNLIRMANDLTREHHTTDIKDDIHVVINNIEQAYLNKKPRMGLETGLEEFDNMIGGLLPGKYIVVAGRPSMGKCLGKGTLVLMFDGTLREVEKLKVNDLIMGPDSKPRKILSTTSGREKMFVVKQNKGISYRANESHILSLKRSRTENKYKNGDIINISIKDYINKSDKFKSNYKGYKVGIEFKHKNVDVDPYFLGLWLADGRKSDVRISSVDKDIVDYLNRYSKLLNHKLKIYSPKDKCPSYAITRKNRKEKIVSLQTKLNKLAVINNKHIPEEYIINSKDIRLSLLAGLIDGNGYYNRKYNIFEIVQKDENMAKQIKFLCDTLGFRTSIKKKKASIKKIGYICDVYRIRFTGNINSIPTRLPRKQAIKWTCNRSWNQTGITVIPDGIGEYYGFELSGDGLFLLEDMTVTHNTAIALQFLIKLLMEGKRCFMFSLEQSKQDIVERCLSNISRLPSNILRNGSIPVANFINITTAGSALTSAKFDVDDTPNASISHIARVLSNYKIMNPDLSLAVVDYIQLMSMGSDEVNELTQISRTFKQLARNLEIPIIVISQLSRAVEGRENKRPIMSDIRGCVTEDTIISCPSGNRTIGHIYKSGIELPEVYTINEKTKEKEIIRPSKIINVGIKKCYKIKTKSGKTLTISGDTPIYTEHGWINVENLKIGNKVVVDT